MIWGDKLKHFRGGEEFQSSRGAEISSNIMTLDKDVMLRREQWEVMWLGGKDHTFDSGWLSLRYLSEPRWSCLADHIIYTSGAQEVLGAGDINV